MFDRKYIFTCELYNIYTDRRTTRLLNLGIIGVGGGGGGGGGGESGSDDWYIVTSLVWY